MINIFRDSVTIVIVYISVIFLLPFKTLFCQDMPYSQQVSNLVSINPAFSGTTLDSRVNFFYRSQWLWIESGIKDFGFEYDTYFGNINSGLGVVFKNEKQGLIKTPSLDVAYSYIVKINHTLYLSMGLQSGINQKYLSKSDIDFRDKEELYVGPTKMYPDFSTGVALLSKNAFFSISADHLHQPYVTKEKAEGVQLNRKYTFFLGYIYKLNTSLINTNRYLSPSFLYQIQAKQQNITWGLSFEYEKLVGGLWMRNNITTHIESLIISLGYKTKSMRFTYSYDINILKRSTRLLEANELSLTYIWDKRKKRVDKEFDN